MRQVDLGSGFLRVASDVSFDSRTLNVSCEIIASYDVLYLYKHRSCSRVDRMGEVDRVSCITSHIMIRFVTFQDNCVSADRSFFTSNALAFRASGWSGSGQVRLLSVAP